MSVLFGFHNIELHQFIYSAIIILSGLPLFSVISVDIYRREKRVPLFLSVLGGLGIFIAFSRWGMFIQIFLFITLINIAPFGAFVVAFSFFSFCVFLFVKGMFSSYSHYS